MASIWSYVEERVAKLVFNEFTVVEARDLSPHFRRFRVTGESLREKPPSPGDKLQIMIPDWGARTFSPFAADAGAGTFEFVAYLHGENPTAAWCRGATDGFRFRAFGPRASLALSALPGPVVLFGDETSFGVARSLADARKATADASFVFEATDAGESKGVLDALGIAPVALVEERREARAHLDAIDAALRAACEQRAAAALVLTGHAQMIQAVRAKLKAWTTRPGQQKVKAYWADGKRGLD